MRKLILLFPLLFLALIGYSQDIQQMNYYAKDGTVSATDGTTYSIYGSDFPNISISNAQNTYLALNADPNLYYKDGRVVETVEEYESTGGTVTEKGIFARVFRELFTDEQIAALRNLRWPMTVMYAVNPEDGTMFEVSFVIGNYPELTSLPPDFYAKLERRLKEEVRWNVNDFSKQLKYVFGTTEVKFKQIPMTSELHQIKPGLEEINLGEEVGLHH